MATRIFRPFLAAALMVVGVSARESYSGWLTRTKVPESKRGLNDAPAGDQVPNAVKFGLGLDPLVASGHAVPQAQTALVQGAQRLVMTIPKNPDAQGVSYVVEGSSDLSNWSAAGMIVTSETATTLTVADATPLTSTPTRFLRLRVVIEDPIPGIVTWDNVASIRAVLDNAIQSYQIPGILYSVKPVGQEPWLDARGQRNLQTNEELAPTDRFRIGSASKTFVGMAALRLISQGKLGFEDSINQYLPAAVLSNYRKDLITVRMLLQHTSGINNYTNLIGQWFMPYITDRTRVWTKEQLVALINDHFADPPEEGGKLSDPGLKWEYSNTNTVLLAMILEKVSGIEIGKYITDNFITPLGLRDTVYPAPGDSTLGGQAAHGYMDWVNFTGEPSLPMGLTDVTIYDPSGVGPAGPMISTTRDLSVWMEAMVRNDQLVGDYRSGHIDWRYYTSFSTSNALPRAGSYGMNIAHEADRTNMADYYIIGHRGQISGFDTAMMYLPEKNVAIVLVCNRSLKFAPGYPTNALEAAMNKVVAILFPDLIAAHKFSTPAAPARAQVLRAATTPFGALRPPLTEYP